MELLRFKFINLHDYNETIDLHLCILIFQIGNMYINHVSKQPQIDDTEPDASRLHGSRTLMLPQF
jgi:hypothetical protein